MFLYKYKFFFSINFLAMHNACRSSKARDQTLATAVTKWILNSLSLKGTLHCKSFIVILGNCHEVSQVIKTVPSDCDRKYFESWRGRRRPDRFLELL